MPNQTQREAAVRILICEHNLALAEDMAENLGDLGYGIAGIVVTGDEAIRTAEGVRPDVILMDIDLPGVPDGVKAADHIITDLDIPVVYLTGYAEHAVRERAKKSEPYGYVDKPVGLSQLRSIVAMTFHRRKAELQARKTSQLLEAINQAQSQFISGDDPQHVFDGLLCELLSLTGSEYGFIDEVFHTAEGIPYRVTHAISNIAWNEETQRFYDEHKSKGFTFYNHNNLSGATMLTGRPVISNDPSNDPRSGGLPKGHPPLKAFLGLPLHSRQKLIGTVGLANRAGGYDEEIVTFLEPYLATCANIIEAYRNEQDRKHAEEVLRESEQRYRTILGTAMDGFWLVDTTGRLLEVNDAYCHMSGYSREELLGMTIPELEAEKTSEDAAAPFWKAVEKGADRFESAHRRKDGNQMHCEMSVQFLPVDGGRFFAFIRDITERKKMDAALKEIRDQQKALLDNIPDIAWLKDNESRYIAANQPLGKACGVAPEDLPGKTDLDLWPVEVAERYRADDREVMASGKRKRVEEPCADKDGNTTWIETIKTPIYNDAGENIGTVGIARDITERKRAEEDLRRSEAKFLDLYENAPAAYFSVGTDSIIRLCNRRAEELLGYVREELIGKTAFELYADEPEGKEKAGNVFKRFLAGEPIADEELQMQKADGSSVWISLTVNGIRDSKGHLVESRSMVLDISERKRTEEALRRLNRELRAISTCNQALLRAVDEQTLINDVCRIVCKEAGYRLAWVGYAENDDARTIRPVAWAGVEDGYLAEAWLSWAETERGLDPAGIAIRHGESACVQDFATDPHAAPWREGAVERGYRSCVALPLKDESESTFGILCIYSTEPHAFTPDEIQLLEDLAGDLAFGINGLRARIERKRTEEALKESEQRLRLALDAARAGTWEWDLRTNKNYWSEELWKLYGLEPRSCEPSYETWLQTVHPDDRRAAEEAVQAASSTGTELNTEWRVCDSHGPERWLMSRGRPLRDEQGESVRYLGIVLDITERKRTEQALKESEEKYRFLVEESFDGLFLMRGTKIVFTNIRLREMLGYGEGELEGRDHWVVYHPDYYEITRSRAQARMRGEPAVNRYEVKLQRKDGSSFDCELVARRIHLGGEPGVQAWFRDISDRKRAEEKTLQLAAIVESSDDAIIGKTLDGIITSWNKGAEEIYGYKETEAVGRPISLLVPPDHQDEIPQLLEEIGRGKHVEHYETVRRKKDGRKVDVSLTISPIRGPEDTIIGASAIARDITELKQVQLRLENERSRLRTLVQTIPDLVWLKDPDGMYLTCNPRVERFFGAKESDIIGKTDHDFVDADLADFFRGHDRKAMDAGKPSINEEWITFADDGHRELLETIKTPMYDSDGTLIGVLGIGRDITAARKAEEAQKRLAIAIEQAAEGIVITDAEGIIQYVNPAMVVISGFGRESLLGKSLRMLTGGEYDETLYRQLWSTIKETNVWSGRLTNKKMDGSLYYEEATISPVKDASGKTTNYVAVMRDITEHLRLSEQLLQAQKMESLGTLAGGIAHDFNNLLQIIIGYSDMLLFNKKPSDREYDGLHAIRQAGRDGAELAKRILAFSRRLEPNARPVNLNNEIVRVQKMLQRTLSKMIRIEILLVDNLMTVNADPGQMEQILLNLAVNAQYAMPDGGRLTIETANITLDEDYSRTHFGVEPGEYVLLTVSDTGHGMEKEVLEHIFEPFYTTKGVDEGTGLGLAMVFGIVKSHKGHIICYSEPGAGTTFKIYLPAIVQEIEQDVAATQQMPAFGTETILLVDDENSIRKLGEEMLRMAGYTVLTATNGREALEIYRSNQDRIALVLLDLMMPEMGGKQCLEELLKINLKVKVVIASGYSANGPTKDALASGAKGFVDKPYDIRQMLEVVREVLDAE